MSSLKHTIKASQDYKVLHLFAMTYMMLALLSTLFVYKIVSLGPAVTTAGALVSPAWYFTADIITEVYGYKMARKIIWAELLLEFIFVVLCANMVNLPSPAYFKNQLSYVLVLGGLTRIFVGSFVGTLSSAFLNTWIVSKFKIIFKGKSFWLRCLFANAVAQLVLSTTTSFIDLLYVIPFIEIIKEIATSFSLKIIAFGLLIAPTSIIAELVKKIEGLDVFDKGINYNPFKVS